MRVLSTGLLLFSLVMPAAAEPPDAVLATVGEQTIRQGEAQYWLDRALGRAKLPPPALAMARAKVLDELVARRLVVAYAQRNGQSPNEAEIKAAERALQARLAVRQQTVAEWLQAQGLGESDLPGQLAWEAVWQKYRARYVTAERMAAWFEAHRRELDGTQLVVSHILLRPVEGKAEKTDAIVARADQLHREILAGRLSFADAAKRHSTGPSAVEGGRLGAIGRQGPMHENFSRAAFALAPGEISPPVETPFGVHLIRCDEVRPGRKQLADVRQEVEDALGHELLTKLARLQRERTPVRYGTAWPHFKPGTQDLAE